MPKTVNANDPRVKRTRQLLIQTFVTLFEEKQSIHAISVQEITDRAGVNRATFYAHFADRDALLHHWMHEKFHRMLVTHFPESSALQLSTLRLLIETVFDVRPDRYYLAPDEKQYEPLFDVALQQELYDLLLRWLRQALPDVEGDAGMIETIAQIISWAICGPAAQWGRGDRAVDVQEMIERVFRVVLAGLSPIITLT